MNVCVTVYIYTYSIAGYHGALGVPPSCPTPRHTTGYTENTESRPRAVCP